MGSIVGSYIKHHVGDANAASENITVTNNNQVSTMDQGAQVMVRTSTVTVKDITATLGYTLSARVENNSIPNSTIKLGSSDSTICTLSNPCTITSDVTPTTILETADTGATGSQGHTTYWGVTVTFPGTAPQGNYIIDIAYSEEPILPPPGPQEPNPSTPTTYGAMQLMTNAQCSTTRGTAFDARNGQTYYVQKIGNLCWMETNLRYAGDGDWYQNWSYPDDRYATTIALAANTLNTNDNTRPLTTTTSGYLGGSSTTQYTYAGYFDPNGSTDYTNTAANGGFYGYLYTWCAAMGGQANACNNTSTSGFDTTQSICPAGWRLPTGGSGGEYQIMANAIGATNDIAGSTNLLNDFLAVYSGVYYSSLAGWGSRGYVWSSSVGAAADAYFLYFVGGSVGPGTNVNGKYVGQAVRCVM